MLINLLFVLVLLVGAALRTVGMDWDEGQHLHPDERFLTMVAAGIQPVESLSGYFDTPLSSLNPHNRGFGFYVYGTLPVFLVRYVAEAYQQTGYDQIHLVGRYLSAFMDLLTVLLVFLTALRLYRSPALSLLAGAFYALAVLPIQLAHYFTVDSFLGFFGFLTFYCAVRVMTRPSVPPAMQMQAQTAVELEEDDLDIEKQPVMPFWQTLLTDWGSLGSFAFFGVALGLAMACKVSAAPLGVLLPVAAYISWSRLSRDEQARQFAVILRNLVLAGVVALLVFRVFQPYAFSGPGFFGLTPNPQWVANLKELAAQSTGDVDFPPALQWARRPIYFAWTNMVQWGLGLPLGLLAWAAFLWMGWRMIRDGWKNHLLLWGWTVVYFTWQEINFTRSMRYQILVYPTLAIIAAWGLVVLWQKTHTPPGRRWMRGATAGLAAVILLGTAGWAVAFAGIYTRPVTRMAASEWIYQNVPAAINARVETDQGEVINHPIAFRGGYNLSPGQEWRITYTPTETITLVDIRFSHVASFNSQLVPYLGTALRIGQEEVDAALAGELIDAQGNGDSRGGTYTLVFDRPVTLEASRAYTFITFVNEPDSVLLLSGPVTLGVNRDGLSLRLALPEPVEPLKADGLPHTVQFTARESGRLSELYLPHVVDLEGLAGEKTLLGEVSTETPSMGDVLARGSLRAQFSPDSDPRGKAYTLPLDPPLPVEAGQRYYLTLTNSDPTGKLALYGSETAIESTWDDSLPLPLYGLSPFDSSTGLYPTDLNLEMYWDDNAEKLERFTSILSQTDYILISSNRQWGTTTRVPERYPLTGEFYRRLIGCSAGQEVFDCYATAAPGESQGELGFELAAVFHSNPRLGPLQFNTQFAEEAFSVYDHPKVLIFKKAADYDPAAVSSVLSAVDLSTVVHVTPRKATKHPANLMLPPERLAAQQTAGTWSDLFDNTALQNLYPGVGLVLWYLVISLLGWLVYPFVRLALRGLPDRGYPLSKLVGLLLLAYFTWLAGSAGIPVTRWVISIVVLLILIGNLVLAAAQRQELELEWQQRRRYFAAVELIALAFFTIDLLIRFGNPDLWHAYKGGEKPMDFAYFNAILKSVYFPPYNPWFSGAYINYYYFGFVIAAVPVKWLGIVPAVAYNLVLPTFFSFLAMAAFSFGWNLLSASGLVEEPTEQDGRWRLRLPQIPLAAGLASAVGVLILGNWGTMRMYWHGLLRLAAPEGIFQGSNLFQKLVWTGQGLVKLVGGEKFTYYPGDWYWIPSRAYPGLVITEFPFFTFLYGDPHAHLFALPLTVLALSWGLSILLGRWQWGDERGRLGWLHFTASLFLGGLVIGSLRPVNTWDLPTYLVLGVAALVYTAWRHGENSLRRFASISARMRHVIVVGGSAALLVGLSFFVLFKPYMDWYAQGYNSFKLWEGERAPFWSYLTHWGVFLFVIVTWLVWETREWMAATPVSSLRKLKPYLLWIQAGVLLLVVLVAGLLVMKVTIAWLALPLAAWTAVLLLRPGQPDAKRAALVMAGSALTLTLFVEVIVLEGDVERMNTVFKFYLQAWTLFALTAAAALVWLWPAVEKVWFSGWRAAWKIALFVLVGGALLFPITASLDKITDRMSAQAPRTLDGMAYMPYGTYSENNKDMTLGEDYLGIRWMQENVAGTPVIVEAHVPEYRWGSRYSIYTGLPAVLGWNWHTRQQRVNTPDEWVWNRVAEIERFYLDPDPQNAVDFLHRYGVKYIIVGQLERALYDGLSLEKFIRFDGQYWKQVFQQGETAIYEVLP